ncbi:MAG: hypothetical protein QXP18_04280 [Sulfolobales archaeon]
MVLMLRLRDPVWLSESLSWGLALAALMTVFNGFSDIKSMIQYGAIPAYLIAISLGFFIHELAHKYVALARGCQARFTISSLGLLITTVFGLFASLAYFLGARLPFVIAAPGYVGIRCSYWGTRTLFGGTTSEGLIAAVGPISNIILSIIGIIGMRLAILIPLPGLYTVFYAIKYVNAVLAVFNLLPIPPLDGYKVARWNPLIYLAISIMALILLVL